MEAYFDDLQDAFRNLLCTSRFIHSRGIDRVVILVNPAAGCLCHTGRRRALLTLVREKGGRTGSPLSSPEVMLVPGTHRGSLGTAAVRHCMQAREEGKRILLMTVGGDGTHMGILEPLVFLPRDQRDHLWIFRFPGGTGNDAADAWTREQALDALGSSESEGILGAVRVTSPGTGTRYCFNIASFGIDAYVVHMNNLLQKRLPGNFYRLFTDIGVLFYGRIHGYRDIHVRRFGTDGSVQEESRENAITVFGASGFRTYGDGKWVLPDARNYCSILKGNLRENLRFKKSLFQARHGELPSCIMDHAWKIEVRQTGPLLMQLDGEVHELDTADFPVVMEAVETGIRYFGAKEISTQSAAGLTADRSRGDNRDQSKS